MSCTKKNIWHIISAVLGFINLVIIVLWMNFYNKNSINVKCSCDAISVQIAIMDVIFVLFTLGLSIAGFIGYNTIKGAAMDKVEKAAQNYINDRLNESSGGLPPTSPLFVNVNNQNSTPINPDS